MQKTHERYDFSKSEAKWQKYWEENNIYKWNANDAYRDNNFVVDTPPPTVSGQLHIGHVYSYTQTDFIVRFQRMKGKNTFYPIGFDDNGLPTERLVEKQKQVKASQMTRAEFIKTCEEVVALEEEKFRKLFKQIALSVDWSLEYQTISPLSRQLSQMSFLDLAQKGQIYRDSQPMLWDPVDQTALAQADVEDKEKLSVMNDILFHTEDGNDLIIATTRPEMLPACVAVFYHPDDVRYQHLQGKYVLTPLFDVKVPILADDIVQQDKGTGLVMCCTFGDTTDILWWKKHKLPAKIILSKQGMLCNLTFDTHCTNPIIANKYAALIDGLKIKDARNKMIEMLREQNLLLKQTEITHTVKCAERSGTPLEILMTPQWFIRSIEHKPTLLKRIDELNWHPQTMKIKLENWINSISWDWCISRQRYFGVPFPAWYSKRNGEEGKIVFAHLDQLPVDPTHDLPFGYTRDEVEPDYDVMDTWATSAISPQLSSHAISSTFAIDHERHQKLFPFDLRPQAHEILRTWGFYTILKSHLHENKLPWKNIMISGWCLAQDRSKMSKSKGNIISPEDLLQTYGADVIRYWTAKAKLGSDTAYCENTMKNGKRLVTKLWNASAFVSQHFDKLTTLDQSLITHPFDQWMVNKLVKLAKLVSDFMLEYDYSSAMHYLEEFFWSIFCDNYLEITKTRAYNQDGLNNDGQYSAILTLYNSLLVMLKLFAPFLPHITEEIYSLYKSDKNLSIHEIGTWPNITQLEFTGLNNNDGDNLLLIIELVRKAKSAKNLSIKALISELQIAGCTLPQALIIDLANVTETQSVKCVENVTKTYEQQLCEKHITIAIK